MVIWRILTGDPDDLPRWPKPSTPSCHWRQEPCGASADGTPGAVWSRALSPCYVSQGPNPPTNHQQMIKKA